MRPTKAKTTQMQVLVPEQVQMLVPEVIAMQRAAASVSPKVFGNTMKLMVIVAGKVMPYSEFV